MWVSVSVLYVASPWLAPAVAPRLHNTHTHYVANRLRALVVPAARAGKLRKIHTAMVWMKQWRIWCFTVQPTTGPEGILSRETKAWPIHNASGVSWGSDLPSPQPGNERKKEKARKNINTNSVLRNKIWLTILGTNTLFRKLLI